MAGFSSQRNGAMVSVEAKNGIFGLVCIFWLNSLDQPQFQPQIWPLASSEVKRRSVFVVFAILMAMSYMSLEILSSKRTKILNGKKVW